MDSVLSSMTSQWTAALFPLRKKCQIDEDTAFLRAWNLKLFEAVALRLPNRQNLSLLDLSQNQGSFLSIIPKHRFSFQLGAEPNASRAKSARQNCGSRYRRFTSRDQLLRKKPKELFDCITLIDSKTFGVAHSWLTKFRTLSSLLKKDGTFILVVPNFDSPWIKEEHYRDRGSLGSPLCLHFKHLEAELARLYPGFLGEFRVTEKSTSHFLSPWLAMGSMEVFIRTFPLARFVNRKLAWGCYIVTTLRKLKD